MKWIRFTIEVPASIHELLIAELMDLELESFEQFDNRLDAWIDASRWDDVKREELERLLNRYWPGAAWRREEVAEQNWNEEWEKSIRPVRVGSFLILPTWLEAAPEEGVRQLRIDPKMSFGTGLHPTTRLMLRFVERLVTGETDSVIDAGTGTGVLSIASVILGAKQVFAFDIDPWSERNARENCEINRVQNRVGIQLGGIETIPAGMKASLILANINRNTLMALLSRLTEHLHPDGDLVLSGLLSEDREAILQRAGEIGWSMQDELGEGEWLALHLTRSRPASGGS